MPRIRITCSILCYNYGRFLAKAIDSCLDQKPGDFEREVLVIDDGSTDDTPQLCARYGSAIRVVRSRNQGFGASLTKAISLARGDYVCLLDADDYFAPQKLATLTPHLQAGAALIYDRKYFIDAEDNTLDETPGDGGNTSTVTVHRATAETLLPAENELFFDAVRASRQFVRLAEPLTYYRRHASSMSRCEEPGKWASELAGATHHLADRLLAGPPLPWISTLSVQLAWGRLYRSQACYKELEAALECGLIGASLRSCVRMLWFAMRSPEGLSSFHVRMIGKTLIRRPSFPRRRSSASDSTLGKRI